MIFFGQLDHAIFFVSFPGGLEKNSKKVLLRLDIWETCSLYPFAYHKNFVSETCMLIKTLIVDTNLKIHIM